jgi:hypothetical protein
VRLAAFFYISLHVGFDVGDWCARMVIAVLRSALSRGYMSDMSDSGSKY